MVLQNNVPTSTRRLMEVYRRTFGELPEGFRLVVSFDLLYVLMRTDDSRLSDKPIMETDDGPMRSCGEMAFEAPLETLAIWSHEKVDKYRRVSVLQ